MPATRPHSRPQSIIQPAPLRRQAPQPPRWAHNFFCLAEPHAVSVPTSAQYKQWLMTAGLGEKRLQMSLTSTSSQVHDVIVQTFPQLSTCGGYELLKCIPNSRTLHPITVPSAGFTPDILKAEVGQGRIYLRPLQRKIPLTPSLPQSETTDLVS